MAHRRAEQPVLLHYNMYLSEVRTIHRESKVFAFPEQFQLQKERRQQPSHGASARGSGGRAECTETQDHDSSEEEENVLFLQAAGFSSVVHDLQREVESGVHIDESGVLDSQTEGLPLSHARLIQKRVHTLRSTLRHKRSLDGEGGTRGDVRDIFGDKSGQETANHVAGSNDLTNHAPASYKSTNDTITLSVPDHVGIGKVPLVPPSKPKTLLTIPFPSPASVAMPTSSGFSPEQPDSRGDAAAPGNTEPLPHEEGEILDLSQLRKRSGSDGAVGNAISKTYQSSPITRRKPVQLHGGGGRKSPKSANSPEHEDIKLTFGVGSPVKAAANGITENLPRYHICAEPLGLTHTIDISPNEQSKVRSLALLELQVTFDDMGLRLQLRRPIKHKNLKEKGVFGVPLTSLLEQDRQRVPNTQLPLILTEILCYLEKFGMKEEGLLRVCGSAVRIKSMLDEIEIKFHCGVFSLENYMASKKDCKVADVASLLKQFIRQLPVPLLTRQYLLAFASIADIVDLKEQVRALNLLILVLPDLHQKVLKRLMEFCQRLVDHSSHNKMTLTNIAMVMAPNLFTNLPTRQNMDDVTMAAKTVHVLRLLINYHDLLWTVPSVLLHQVRNLNECEVKRVNQKSLQKAMRQVQDREPVLKKSVSYMVPVYGPLYLCVRKMIHIQTHTTAAEVVDRFEHKTQLNRDLIRKRFIPDSPVDDTFDPTEVAGPMFLHEVGGNIVERCLPPDTNMYLLYETNPNTEFVIKPRHCPDILPVRK